MDFNFIYVFSNLSLYGYSELSLLNTHQIYIDGM